MSKIKILIILFICFIFFANKTYANTELKKEDFFSEELEDNVSEEIDKEIKKSKLSHHLANEPINVTLEVNRELNNNDRDILKMMGCKIISEFDNTIFLSLTKKNLKNVSELDFIKIIRKPSLPIQTNSISLEKAGESLNLEKIKKLPYKGKGVKIALIDYGFKLNTKLKKQVKGIFSLTPNNDLTGEDEWRHGNAILEIIEKIAPEAQIYLININKNAESYTLLLPAIKYAVENFRVNIVSLSINDAIPKDFFDGTGIYGKTLNEYSKKYNTIFVTAIGNNLKKHYKNIYKPNNNGLHDFNGKNLTFELKKNQTVNIVLSWKEENFKYPAYNFDFVITDEKTGKKYFERSKTGNSYKTLSFIPENDSKFKIDFYAYHFRKVGDKIEKYDISEKDSLIFNVILYSKNLNRIENFTPNSSLDPNLAVVPSAITIGALVNSNNEYSSWGAGEKNLLKPDFVAPSGIMTDALSNFDGSSASVPFISSLVALVISKNKKLNLNNIKKILKESSSSKNNWSKAIGYGKVDFEKALNLVKN